jgi:hypothetical protein
MKGLSGCRERFRGELKTLWQVERAAQGQVVDIAQEELTFRDESTTPLC